LEINRVNQGVSQLDFFISLPLGVHLFCVAKINRTKQKASPCLPYGFPALLDEFGHGGNSLRSNSRPVYPNSSAMLGAA